MWFYYLFTSFLTNPIFIKILTWCIWLLTLVWRHNDQHCRGTVQRLRANQPRQTIQLDLFISRPRGGCRHFELHDCKVSGVTAYMSNICIERVRCMLNTCFLHTALEVRFLLNIYRQRIRWVRVYGWWYCFRADLRKPLLWETRWHSD